MIDIDDLVERWHSGEWPYRRLEDVVREHTEWTAAQYDEWVRTAAVPNDPSERRRHAA